jgi:hypothetical protein
MIEGEQYFVCGLPYHLSIKEGLLMKSQIADEMSESDFDRTSFDIEMGCMFFGESANAYFKLEDLQKNRKLSIKPFYPMDLADYGSKKKKSKLDDYPRAKGEIRLIGVDVALCGGAKNDNSIFTCMRLIPNGDHYLKHVVYIESVNGMHSEIQAIKLKRLFMDFKADYVIIDCQGNGMAIFDSCAKLQYDSETDVHLTFGSKHREEYIAMLTMDSNREIREKLEDIINDYL